MLDTAFDKGFGACCTPLVSRRTASTSLSDCLNVAFTSFSGSCLCGSKSFTKAFANCSYSCSLSLFWTENLFFPLWFGLPDPDCRPPGPGGLDLGTQRSDWRLTAPSLCFGFMKERHASLESFRLALFRSP